FQFIRVRVSNRFLGAQANTVRIDVSSPAIFEMLALIIELLDGGLDKIGSADFAGVLAGGSVPSRRAPWSDMSSPLGCSSTSEANPSRCGLYSSGNTHSSPTQSAEATVLFRSMSQKY